MDAQQNITEVCRMLDLTSRTIRYYEQFGLIHTVRDSKTAPRRIDSENFERLRKIRFLRKLGLSLDEIKTVIDSDDAATECIRSKTAELSAEINALAERIRLLEIVLSTAEQGGNIYSAEQILDEPAGNPENLAIAATVAKLFAERRFTELPPYMNSDFKKTPAFYEAVWDSHIKPCGKFISIGTQYMDGSTIVTRLHYEKQGVLIRTDVCGGLICGIFLQYFNEKGAKE